MSAGRQPAETAIRRSAIAIGGKDMKAYGFMINGAKNNGYDRKVNDLGHPKHSTTGIKTHFALIK
jgi:hypothetical protein